jgi:hypothetical protein
MIILPPIMAGLPSEAVTFGAVRISEDYAFAGRVTEVSRIFLAQVGQGGEIGGALLTAS